MCIKDVNNKDYNVYVFLRDGWDGMTLLLEYFLTNFCISDIFLSNLNFLTYYFILQCFYFYNVFALDSHKISSVLNSRLSGPRQRARSHIN